MTKMDRGNTSTVASLRVLLPCGDQTSTPHAVLGPRYLLNALLNGVLDQGSSTYRGWAGGTIAGIPKRCLLPQVFHHQWYRITEVNLHESDRYSVIAAGFGLGLKHGRVVGKGRRGRTELMPGSTFPSLRGEHPHAPHSSGRGWVV